MRKMKKVVTLALSILIGVILIAGLIKLLQPTPSTSSSIPLGIGVYNSDDVEFFNKYARDDDRIAVKPQNIDLLDDVKVGRKTLLFGGLYDPSEMVSLAREKGIKIIAYNLERADSKEELISKEKEAYELAKENDLLFVFGPTVGHLEVNYQDFVQYADVIALQSQRYQLQEDYEEVVEGLIEKIKSANPNVQVWVQVSVHPPDLRTLQRGKVEYVHLSADQVIDHIRLIEDKADSVSIFYFPPRDPSNVAEEVFKKLRERTKP